ncbi:mechanosensitive ion channel family protein [Reichenbachiella ulvae]|uniref:Mechanosensitive ion channel family protein n=1 Tax=Reichenbachiella ulvae TaxID=2980104 RepID=A0ABT3CPI5_9BACT|nr:mechanosensitive ion channel family protein [Reichenbachiella ulvae]MCV9385448.1 mechanosensitive ion channel family protein [Reichenbachiella ulvae]
MNFNLSRAIDILQGKLENWLENLTAMLPNLVVAVLVVVFFYFIAKLLRAVAKKLLDRFVEKGAISNLFSAIIYLITMGVGLIIALNLLKLEQTVTSLLAGAGIIGLALGFAFQDITANFIAGVLMAFRKPIQVGDIISTSNYTGTVEEIDLRATIIRTFQGLHVIIPNKDVFQTPVTNFTKTYDRRIDLEVGVSYAEDLERVRDIAIGAVSKLPYLLPGQEVKLFYHEFGDSSINFTIMLWIHYPDEPGYLRARSEAIIAIKKAFDQNGITIPFPIRTLDFGIKGGEKLSEMTLHHDKD